MASNEADETDTLTSHASVSSQLAPETLPGASSSSELLHTSMEISDSELRSDDIKSIDSVKSSDIHDYHHVELLAHAVLSGSLENIHDNFELLHKSQVILLTRLKLLEQKLSQIKHTNDSLIDHDIANDISRIKVIRKRLQGTQRKVAEIDKRVEKMNLKLCLDNV